MFIMNGGANSANGGKDRKEDNRVPGTDGRVTDNECYICNKIGYISWFYPEAGNTGPPPRRGRNCTQVMLTQQCIVSTKTEPTEIINPQWILALQLVFAAIKIWLGISESALKMKMVKNGEEQRYEHLTVLKDLPLQVHFKEDSMANILSLRDIANMPSVKLTIDSIHECVIHVTLTSVAVVKFEECPDGLYHLDTSHSINNIDDKSKSIVNPYSFAIRVANNENFFYKREIKGAEDAHKLEQQLGWQSIGQFRHIVANNLVPNSPISIADIDRAHTFLALLPYYYKEK